MKRSHFFFQGNFEDAKIFYQQCLAIEPNYGLAQYHMGQIHMHNGKKKHEDDIHGH